jgi:hypothetical protein
VPNPRAIVLLPSPNLEAGDHDLVGLGRDPEQVGELEQLDPAPGKRRYGSRARPWRGLNLTGLAGQPEVQGNRAGNWGLDFVAALVFRSSLCRHGRVG